MFGERRVQRRTTARWQGCGVSTHAGAGGVAGGKFARQAAHTLFVVCLRQVYDITDETTFRNIHTWVAQIDEHADVTVNRCGGWPPEPAV